MAEQTREENEATKETAAQAEGNGEKTSEKNLARRATRSLRRARQTYQNNEWQASSEAEFLVREANVLAVMDLAEAVREMHNSRQKG